MQVVGVYQQCAEKRLDEIKDIRFGHQMAFWLFSALSLEMTLGAGRM